VAAARVTQASLPRSSDKELVAVGLIKSFIKLYGCSSSELWLMNSERQRRDLGGEVELGSCSGLGSVKRDFDRADRIRVDR
jgi:hypothetical protein